MSKPSTTSPTLRTFLRQPLLREVEACQTPPCVTLAITPSRASVWPAHLALSPQSGVQSPSRSAVSACASDSLHIQAAAFHSCITCQVSAALSHPTCMVADAWLMQTQTARGCARHHYTLVYVSRVWLLDVILIFFCACCCFGLCNLAVVPPGYFLPAGASMQQCSASTFREGWLMFSDLKATACTPCGQGISSEPRDLDENPKAQNGSLVRATSASCCKLSCTIWRVCRLRKAHSTRRVQR